MSNAYLLKWWLTTLMITAPILLIISMMGNERSVITPYELAIFSIPVSLVFSLPAILVIWIINWQLGKMKLPRLKVKLILQAAAIGGACLTLIWFQFEAPLLILVYSISTILTGLAVK